MSLESNQQAISAKQILEGCGLSVVQVGAIASEYGINIDQAAEKAEQVAELGLSSELIFKHLMENANATQKKVQRLIAAAVSEKAAEKTLQT